MTAELVTSFPSRRIPAAEGDTEFEKFYARYNPQLVGWATRAFGAADGEDIAQETMSRALVHFHEFEPGRDPWPWLCVVARRVGTDIVRSRARTVVVEDHQLAEMPTADGETPVDHALANDDRRALRRALAKLSVSDRRVLRLREYDDLSSSDMAALLDCSETAVRQQLFRARRRLAEHFRALGAFSALSPAMLVARATRKRTGRLLGKLTSGTGSVTATGMAMSALVMVGGPVVAADRLSPRVVDLSPATAAVRSGSAPGSMPDRLAGYAALARGGSTTASGAGQAAPPQQAITAPGGAATLTVENGRPVTFGHGARHSYRIRVFVGDQEVLEVGTENTDPNNYGVVCNTPVLVCE